MAKKAPKAKAPARNGANIGCQAELVRTAQDAEIRDALAALEAQQHGANVADPPSFHPLPHRADFDRGSYDAVAKLIEPDFIVSNLKQRYGAELDTPQFHHGNETSLACRIAH